MSTTRMRGTRTPKAEAAPAPAQRKYQTWAERWLELTPEQQEGHRKALEAKAERRAARAAAREARAPEPSEPGAQIGETTRTIRGRAASILDRVFGHGHDAPSDAATVPTEPAPAGEGEGEGDKKSEPPPP